jgi:hypothetical protein
LNPNYQKPKSSIMRKIYTLIFVIIAINTWSQEKMASQAWLDENSQVQVKEILISEAEYLYYQKQKTDYEQLENWPKRIAAHPNFKNFRGVTLADITGDGVDEILVASYSRLYAYKGNGDLLWSMQLTGTATYPPSVADVTGNGQLELVQLTGGIPNNGRAYVIDKDGNVLPGWPVSINNNWLLSAPALADLDGDGQMEIIFGVRTVNEIHVLKADGTNFNENWPVVLSSIPAFTPSVGDINNDGEMNIIAGASNGTMYAFNLNAEILPGFPVASTGTSFSYQSPLLTDFDGDSLLSIVGATHGTSPEYYVRNSDGSYREGWPVAVPDANWTYHPPTLADINNDSIYEIFTARPIGETPAPMLFGFDTSGEMLPDFPISKSGGLESLISVADIDIDGQHDLIFGSNMMIDGKGFIHAYYTDGSGELPGFPLRPDGFTFMNGANLGDVTGDGMLNLVALSYEQTFSPSDSAVINVWNLGITLEEADVLFGTYKGNNTRNGFMKMEEEPGPEFYQVTFNLDLSEAEGYFDPEVDDFFITGSMIEWAEPGTQPDVQLLERVDDSMIFTRTIELVSGEYEFKYFLNEGWEGGEWEGGPNHEFVLENVDLELWRDWAAVPGGIMPEVSNLELVINPVDGGTVEGAGMYLPNANVFILAEAAENYSFINWTDGENEVTNDPDHHFFMPRANLTLTANFNPETGVDELISTNLQLFPNPAQDRFTLRSQSIMNHITITEITGKQLLNLNVNISEIEIDAPLQSGIYIITVVTDDGVFVRKLQVQK